MLTACPRRVQAAGPQRWTRGEARPEDNASSMSLPGSEEPRPFPALGALGVTALGILAMVGGGFYLALHSGLSLRPQIALGTLLLAAPALLALALAPQKWPAVHGPRPATSRLLILSVVLGTALWVASAGLLEVQSLLVPPTQEDLDRFRAIHAALAPRTLADALVSIFVIAVLPGLCEELVMRGVLLPSLARAWKGSLAVPIAITAVLFALMHFDGLRFAFTLSLGLVFGWLRLATGSLWPSVVAHVSLNTLTFLVAPYVDDPSKAYSPSPVMGAACLAAGAAVAWPLLRTMRVSFDSPRADS
jgi:membrane protease YdiL (CAAX protease family)